MNNIYYELAQTQLALDAAQKVIRRQRGKLFGKNLLLVGTIGLFWTACKGSDSIQSLISYCSRSCTHFQQRCFRHRTGQTNRNMYADKLLAGRGGVGIYPPGLGRANGWVHVDVRKEKSRWRG